MITESQSEHQSPSSLQNRSFPPGHDEDPPFPASLNGKPGQDGWQARLLDRLRGWLSLKPPERHETPLQRENRRLHTRNRLLRATLAKKSREVKRQLDRLTLVEHATNDCIWDWDLLANRFTWNENTQLMFGYAPQEIRDDLDWWTDRVHPEDRQAAVDSLHETIDAGQHFWSGEYRFLKGNGQYALVQDRGFVLHDEQHRPIRMIGSMRDVSEKKQAEQRIKESETRFQGMADSSPVLIWVTDADDQTTYLNKTWLDFTGRGLAEEIREGWGGRVHPDDTDACREACRQAKENRASLVMEFRLLNSENQYRWMLDTAKPRYNQDGTFAGYIGSMIDITDRKVMEERLRESEGRFRTMADSAPFVMVMSDIETEGFHFNREWMLFTGRQACKELGNRWFFATVHPDDRRYCLRQYQRSVASHRKCVLDFRLKRYDGEYRWVYAMAGPRYGEEGKLLGFIGSCVDITERRQIEEENRRLSQELERRVIARTAELEAVNKELESFSYSVSHDLRAPLRGIDGISMAILEDYEGRLDDTGREYLRILRQESQKMSQLIDEMLSLSRLTRDAMTLDWVDLSAIAMEIAQGLQAQEPQRQVRFHLAEGLRVWGDRHLLYAVLQNLLGNAWKFTAKHDQARIEFGGLPVMNEAGQAETAYFVRDDGAGFDMKYAAKMFDAFQRLHGATEFAGTGIGLATVQRIIHRHGGRLWAEGAVEQGATIYFTLPPNVLEGGSPCITT